MLKGFTFFDVMVGLPAGLVIFMSTLMSSALLRSRGLASNWLELLLLAINAAIVGWLIRISRKKQAVSSAIASGVVGALVLLFLRISSPENAALNPLVFGAPGMMVAFGICVLAARAAPSR
jgi:hypothetical protein